MAHPSGFLPKSNFAVSNIAGGFFIAASSALADVSLRVFPTFLRIIPGVRGRTFSPVTDLYLPTIETRAAAQMWGKRKCTVNGMAFKPLIIEIRVRVQMRDRENVRGNVGILIYS